MDKTPVEDNEIPLKLQETIHQIRISSDRMTQFKRLSSDQLATLLREHVWIDLDTWSFKSDLVSIVIDRLRRASE